MTTILRLVLAITYGVAAFAVGYLGIIAVLILTGGVHGPFADWFVYLLIPLSVFSLVVVYKAFKGWGMPSRLLDPHISSSDETIT